jgi:uncharacterized protein
MGTPLSMPVGIVSSEAAIQIEGTDHPELSGALVSLLVEETSDGLYRCELRFGNWGASGQGLDYRFFDRQTLEFGKAIVVRMGAGDGEGEVFAGRISALEGQFSSTQPPAIVVLAEDRLQDLRVTRRTRAFENMTDQQAFEQIAGDHGLTPQIDVQGPTHALLAQVSQSDLAFVRERARWLDADVWVAGQTLHVQHRLNRLQDGPTDFELTLGSGLLEFSATADLANQFSEVVVSGWDVQDKQRISESADQNALGSELGQDQSGAEILQDAFSGRTDRIAHPLPVTRQAAQELAKAAFRGSGPPVCQWGGPGRR